MYSKPSLSNHYKNLLLPFLRTNRCIITWYLSTTAYWKPSFFSMQDIFARLATSRHSKYISLQDLSRKVNNIFMYYNIFIEDSSNNAKKRKSCQDNKILVTDVITNNFQNENLFQQLLDKISLSIENACVNSLQCSRFIWSLLSALNQCWLLRHKP